MLQPERIRLANLPTPLIRLERLGGELGGAKIWMKRDDLTGLELSGNKVRKLEFIAADALAHDCDTLVTEGTPQSNHCRATAAVCARLGLRCTLLLRPPPPPGPPLGNHLLDVVLGAEIRSYPRAEFAQRHDAIVDGVLDELRAMGHRPRFTPMGASEPLGCWGYIAAIRELAEQLQLAGVNECDVVMAISSGATYTGALLGQLLHGPHFMRLWAVPVSDDVQHHMAEVERLCRATNTEFGLEVLFDLAEPRFLDGYVGEGYAIPYPAAIEALRLLARTEAILLDPVYTAKAFCALLDGVRAGQFGHERPVVFLHTGGLMSDFAWPELLAAR